MIKEFIVSFFDNVKTKTTNPFLGTLIIVWIFENWKLLYTFFGLSDELTLNEKIKELDYWLNAEYFTLNLVKCIGIAIIVLIATYFLLNLSRLIINLFENRVTPYVYLIFGPGKVVTKELYNAVAKEVDSLSIKLEKEREMRIKFQNEVSSLEDVKAQLILEVAGTKEKSSTILELEKTIDNFKNNSVDVEKYETLKSHYNLLLKEIDILKRNSDKSKLESRNNENSNKDKSDGQVVEAFFIQNGKSFISLSNSINNNLSINRDIVPVEAITKFISLGLINKISGGFALTDKGLKYLNYYYTNESILRKAIN